MNNVQINYTQETVAASHNPVDYNGIKVFTEGGSDTAKEITDNFENIQKDITLQDVKQISFEKGIEEGKYL